MDGGQRAQNVFVMVAVTDYAEHPGLDGLRDVVPRLSEVLRRSGFRQELTELGDGGTFSQVNTALGRWEPGVGIPRLLYWAGHGHRDHVGDFLLVQDTPVQQINASTAMSAGALASILAGLPVAHTAVVIDTCFAGGSATEVVRVLLTAFDRQSFPGEQPSVTIIAASGPHDHLQDGQFTRRFHQVLEHGWPGPAWSSANNEVRLSDVVRSVREECLNHGDPGARHYQ